MDWNALVIGLATPIVLYWLTQGVAAYVKTWQARRADLASDERDAEAQEEADLRIRARTAEARVRVLDDYAHTLRRQIAELGGTPAPWPPLFTTAD